MKTSLSLTAASFFIALIGCQSDQSDTATTIPTSENSLALAQEMIIADTHVDLPYRLEANYENVLAPTSTGDFDVPRARSGGLNAPFMSIYTPAGLEFEEVDTSKGNADQLIDMIEALVAQAPDQMAIVRSWSELEIAVTEGKLALPLGMENGSPIEGNLDNLQHFYDRGIRYITLAHSRSNHIADSSYDTERPAGGLTEFGEAVIREMNRLGIMVDISHVSDEAFYDVLEVTSKPVIASHSSARHFTPGFERNMSDEMITALGEQGGVIFINFGSAFLTEAANNYGPRQREFLANAGVTDADSEEAIALVEQWKLDNPYPYATLEDVLDHIDHAVALAGINAVGIGSDYDGVDDTLPVGLKDVSSYPNLIEGLLARGYSINDVEKIMSGNLKRVWLEVEQEA
ncbi:dipeptidase [uncultured Umboniibacter sp.]|uniref:dipeptidase n=1 Tax=uncultured Umboniibacter sp. TaxID=1798917 RepID=UPI002630CC3F|nr:dipeptidase [uncultured Umboniibacter sp.]